MDSGAELRKATLRVRGVDWTRVRAADTLRSVALLAPVGIRSADGITHTVACSCLAVEEWVLITGRFFWIMLSGQSQREADRAKQKEATKSRHLSCISPTRRTSDHRERGA